MCTRVRGRYTGKCYTSKFRAKAERKVIERAEKRGRNIAFKYRGETHLTRVCKKGKRTIGSRVRTACRMFIARNKPARARLYIIRHVSCL